MPESCIKKKYERWLAEATADADLMPELESIRGKEEEIKDRFYRMLEFGTAGLRGVIGAGTNRMNVYTVGLATQGYCNILKKRGKNLSVAIAYDSRTKSTLFARTAAEIFAGNGIIAFIFPELMPTPALSFAVRYLGCDGGVNITASHNPAKYNGYKAYDADGCQIDNETADAVLKEIGKTDIFSGISSLPYAEAESRGLIRTIGEDVTVAFLSRVSDQSLNRDVDKSVSIVYTPLNGAGMKCVTHVLEKNGFTNIFVVPEQAEPDENFTTCPYPNPEIREALQLGLDYARKLGSDMLLATDPDCDRVGIAVREGSDYRLLTGNQVGVMLLDYICHSRIALGIMPDRPVAVKTIVTTDLTEKVAAKYGVELRNVLTGFKYIGQQIAALEKEGHPERFILGFEESYGYLTGTYVRDKDGVNASLLICEMFAYYKQRGISLAEVLEGIYKEHGYFMNDVQNFAFEGEDGFKVMEQIISDLRASPQRGLLNRNLVCIEDYLLSEKIENTAKTPILLPKSNVLKFCYQGDLSVVVRPSGTEPKLKLYGSVKGDTAEEAEQLSAQLQDELYEWIDRYQG